MGLRGAHGHPGLPASEAAAGSEGDSDNPAAVGHERSCLTDGDEERLSLGIHGGVPFFERDIHGRFVEGRGFGAGIADEDVERAELRTNLLKHAADFLGLADVGLDNEAIGTVSANFFESSLGGFPVAIVVNGYARSFFGKLEGNAAANAAGTSRDENVFSAKGHKDLLLWPDVSPASARGQSGRPGKTFTETTPTSLTGDNKDLRGQEFVPGLPEDFHFLGLAQGDADEFVEDGIFGADQDVAFF
jgi:hypothetical protein